MTLYCKRPGCGHAAEDHEPRKVAALDPMGPLTVHDGHCRITVPGEDRKMVACACPSFVEREPPPPINASVHGVPEGVVVALSSKRSSQPPAPPAQPATVDIQTPRWDAKLELNAVTVFCGGKGRRMSEIVAAVNHIVAETNHDDAAEGAADMRQTIRSLRETNLQQENEINRLMAAMAKGAGMIQKPVIVVLPSVGNAADVTANPTKVRSILEAALARFDEATKGAEPPLG